MSDRWARRPAAGTGSGPAAHDPLAELDAIEERVVGQHVVDEKVEWANAYGLVAGEMRWMERARAVVGAPVRVAVRDVAAVQQGVLTEVLRDGLLISSGRHQLLVATSGLLWIAGLPMSGRVPAGGASKPLGVSAVLARWAQARTSVRVALLDGRELAGRVLRVGHDHLDLEASTGPVTLPEGAWTMISAAAPPP